MLSKRLLGLNGILVASGLAFATQLGYVYFATPATAPPASRPSPGARPPARPAAEPDRAESRAGLASYSVIAAKNLFSPGRAEVETPAPGAAAGPVTPPPPPAPKPFLHGVVIGDSSATAYLEDPNSKRTAGYRVGDSITGGTVESITFDRVVLKRQDGLLEIKLKDPSKPRPVVAEAPGQQGQGRPGAPGVQPGAVPPQPAVQGAPAAPGTPARPGLLRRLPRPLVGRDAPPQQ